MPMPMTEKQGSFLIDLINTVYANDATARTTALVLMASYTLPEATQKITLLLDAKKQMPAPAIMPSAPTGFTPPKGKYLVNDKIIEVKVSQKSGATYITGKSKGDHSSYYMGLLDNPKNAEYAKVLTDKDAAMQAAIAWSHETGGTHCGVCGKKLTDPHSIAKKIGPVCEGKFA